ncbi:MAG: chorismate mutase, partial [Myxococcota bacterium]
MPRQGPIPSDRSAQSLRPADSDPASDDINTKINSAINPEIAAQLETLREQIDEVDAEILDRLNRRAACVQRVGQLKQGGRRGP